jgi:hypothetical protein
VVARYEVERQVQAGDHVFQIIKRKVAAGKDNFNITEFPAVYSLGAE